MQASNVQKRRGRTGRIEGLVQVPDLGLGRGESESEEEEEAADGVQLTEGHNRAAESSLARLRAAQSSSAGGDKWVVCLVVAWAVALLLAALVLLVGGSRRA